LESEFCWTRSIEYIDRRGGAMNIEHLRTFLEIAETGNFNRAAERLHVTQSTVSARIRTLEEQLDRSLFVRARNGAELTAAGRHFQRYALTTVRAWQQARQRIALPEGLRRPAYLVYPTSPAEPDLLAVAVAGLRAAAGETD
jgi:DNA-binding transcriptional LysR family regulator